MGQLVWIQQVGLLALITGSVSMWLCSLAAMPLTLTLGQTVVTLLALLTGSAIEALC